MPLFNMTTLRTLISPGQRLLGLDPGSKTIGVALTDVTLMLASPFGHIARGKMAPTSSEISRIAIKHDVGGIVIGLPLSLDGTAGPAAQAARDWAHALSDATGLPAALYDERLSSAAVNRFLTTEADMTRKRRSEVVDKMAAAYMLQAALDASIPEDLDDEDE